MNHEVLFSILAGVIIALQSWILIEIIGLKVWRAAADAQLGRLVSDAESEKGTHQRVHADYEARLRVLEKHANIRK